MTNTRLPPLRAPPLRPAGRGTKLADPSLEPILTAELVLLNLGRARFDVAPSNPHVARRPDHHPCMTPSTAPNNVCDTGQVRDGTQNLIALSGVTVQNDNAGISGVRQVGVLVVEEIEV